MKQSDILHRSFDLGGDRVRVTATADATIARGYGQTGEIWVETFAFGPEGAKVPVLGTGNYTLTLKRHDDLDDQYRPSRWATVYGNFATLHEALEVVTDRAANAAETLLRFPGLTPGGKIVSPESDR